MDKENETEDFILGYERFVKFRMDCPYCKKPVKDEEKHYSLNMNLEKKIGDEIKTYDSIEVARYCIKDAKKFIGDVGGVSSE